MTTMLFMKPHLNILYSILLVSLLTRCVTAVLCDPQGRSGPIPYAPEIRLPIEYEFGDHREPGQAMRRKRLIGGERSKVPYMVAIETYGSWQNFCSGTIVDECWVLTAAHCVANVTHIRALAGSDDRLESKELFFDKIIVHEGYLAETKYQPYNPEWPDVKVKDDIALLRLWERLDVRPGSRFASVLLPLDVPSFKFREGMTIVSSGFGLDERTGFATMRYKRSLNNVVLYNLMCRTFYRHFDAKKQFCTGLRPYNGTTTGDYGGPVTYSYEGTLIDGSVGTADILVGVASHTLAVRKEAGTPDYHMMVDAYTPWMREYVQRHSV